MSRRRRSDLPDLYKQLRHARMPWWAIGLVLIAAFCWQQYADREVPPADPADPNRTYRIERVVDGDTLVLAGGERVRLIGVNTPETVKPNWPVEPFGPEASAFTKRLAEGRTATLGFDRERRDKYGRTLAYVYLDGVMLNEEILRAGLGHAELQYPFAESMKRRFRAAEAEAKAARRGLWGAAAKRAA